MKVNKAVSWFSCGAASAVTSKLALKKYGDDVDIVYCDTGSEHESNMQFLHDCEKWFDREIIIMKNEEYDDVLDVLRKKKFITNQYGFAYCTHELKIKLRNESGYCDSINLFGYTSEETKRAEKLQEHTLDMTFEFPLIEKRLNKDDTLGIIWKAGIKLPLMYELGYDHNNCIGCIKGGIGYWNKIRIDFPEQFNAMADLERELGITVLKYRSGERIGQRMYLDELDPSAGNFNSEPNIQCGLDCNLTMMELNKEDNNEQN